MFPKFTVCQETIIFSLLDFILQKHLLNGTLRQVGNLENEYPGATG